MCWLLEWNDVLGKTPSGSAEIEPSTLDLSLLGKEFFSGECVEQGLQVLPPSTVGRSFPSAFPVL
jgi:hypothetical protein